MVADATACPGTGGAFRKPLPTNFFPFLPSYLLLYQPGSPNSPVGGEGSANLNSHHSRCPQFYLGAHLLLPVWPSGLHPHLSASWGVLRAVRAVFWLWSPLASGPALPFPTVWSQAADFTSPSLSLLVHEMGVVTVPGFIGWGICCGHVLVCVASPGGSEGVMAYPTVISCRLWIPGPGFCPVFFVSCCWRNHSAVFFQFLGPREILGLGSLFSWSMRVNWGTETERGVSLLLGVLCSGAREEEERWFTKTQPSAKVGKGVSRQSGEGEA